MPIFVSTFEKPGSGRKPCPEKILYRIRPQDVLMEIW